MSKLTSFNVQIPNRISVSFDNKTEKFVISTREDGSLKIEKNRKVLKNTHNMQEVLNCIAEMIGCKPSKKPDFREKDFVRVPLENGFYERSMVCAEPILNYSGEWVVPCHLYSKGTQYIPAKDLKLIRRVK